MASKKPRLQALRLRRLVSWGLLALLLASFFNPGALHQVLARLPKIQFGQQLAGVFSRGAVSFVVTFVALALLSVVLGRLFCGFVCPLGALLDLTNFFRQKIKRRGFGFVPSGKKRLAVFPAVMLALFWLGSGHLWGRFEPYSVVASGHFVILALVMALTVRRGRAFCNGWCPTGLVLRFLAWKPKIALHFNREKCLGCGSCQRACPASCVDLENRTIDSGRCLMCLECLPVCPNGSLKYGPVPGPVSDYGRRDFLRLTGVGVLTAGAWLTKSEWRTAGADDEPSPAPILPPGALSVARLNGKCSLCHTCIKACPNRALRPSRSPHAILASKPVVEPYEGFCQYECVVCTEVCPTGALTRLSVESKVVSRLGVARLDREECVVVKNGTSCGACAELCPTGGVAMGPGPSGRDEPTMSTEYCIGCGACQNACPVRPAAAIVVDGLSIQQTAVARVVGEYEDVVPEEDFPF
ncbi:MAG: 4Fe-4S binding protein [Deltaproteobacteria bacterium]|jgi:polyferredoxin|nr:4Fe-4S binding protein [Deltaproteobacteria bacterium]